MRERPRATPVQAFQTVTILHWGFTAAVFIYLAIGEIIRWSDPEFQNGGFVALGDEIWLIRAILILVSAVQLMRMYGLGDKFVHDTVHRAEEVNDGTVIVGLMNAFIHRLAITESIALFGLVLYLVNGERSDLYGFCAVALLNFLLIRPRRSKWQSIFRQFAVEHPGVSSSPW